MMYITVVVDRALKNNYLSLFPCRHRPLGIFNVHKAVCLLYTINIFQKSLRVAVS